MTTGLQDLQNISGILSRLKVESITLRKASLSLRKKGFTFFWQSWSAEDRNDCRIGFPIRNTVPRDLNACCPFAAIPLMTRLILWVRTLQHCYPCLSQKNEFDTTPIHSTWRSAFLLRSLLSSQNQQNWAAFIRAQLLWWPLRYQLLLPDEATTQSITEIPLP